MSARRTPYAALQAVSTPEDRKCQRNNCSRQSVDHVRFEGDSTTRALCGRCKKEHLKVSS